MRLRPYQNEAVFGALTQLEEVGSTLIVQPTGTGKTVTFAEIIRRVLACTTGKALVLAHREELIWQAADKIAKIAGYVPEIEMGQENRIRQLMPWRVACSTVQTFGRRLDKLADLDWSLVIIDEAHHAVADSYRKIIDAIRKHRPGVWILGVTATPDRTDELALGAMFRSVAFDYEMNDAVKDGWLVPVRQSLVYVEDLDYSNCKTTAGDLNQHDIAAAQQDEEVIHGMVKPTIDLARGRKTIVFASPGKYETESTDDYHVAERITEVFNRYLPDSAVRISGETDKQVRADTLKNYAAGKFQFLVNVGVFTEGFDEPGIEVVSMMRPTESRSLYAQMIGRGTRPLPGVVDALDEARDRCSAIAASPKPFVHVVDFTGNSGKHKLVTARDILGGDVPDAIMERVAKIAEEGGERDVIADIARAVREASEEEKARRREVLANVQYAIRELDPFKVLDISPMRERGWAAAERCSDKQAEVLRNNGIDPSGIGKRQASKLIDEIFARRDQQKATYQQSARLYALGLDTNVTREEARKNLAAFEGTTEDRRRRISDIYQKAVKA